MRPARWQLSLISPHKVHLIVMTCVGLVREGIIWGCVLGPGYVEAVANDKFTPTPEDPGFSLTGGMKDVGHMQRLGRESGAPMPIVDIILQHMQQVKDMGGASLDWSGLALAVRKDAGLPLSHLQ